MESCEMNAGPPEVRRKQKFTVGGVLVIALFSVSYWLPLGWWMLRYVFATRFQLPADFPLFLILQETFLVSAVAAAGAITGAYPIVLLWRFSPYRRVRYTLVFAMVIPLIMGLLARNYSWIGMLSAHSATASMGWSLLGGNKLLYSTPSVYLVMGCIFVPLAFFMLIQGALAVKQEHIEAARTLGLPDWKIVFVVAIPQTFRAAALAFGFIFTIAVGYFVTPRMIGGGKVDFIGNAVLTYLSFGRFDIASALAIVFLAAVSIPALVVTVFAIRRRIFVTGR
jgi:putative spermidine/putrescine transport system permease protein